MKADAEKSPVSDVLLQLRLLIEHGRSAVHPTSLPSCGKGRCAGTSVIPGVFALDTGGVCARGTDNCNKFNPECDV